MFTWCSTRIICIGPQCPSTGLGPHAMSCLIEWWLEAGCNLDGELSPINDGPVNMWHGKPIEFVKEDMVWYFESAHWRLGGMQDCFGMP